MMLTKSVFFLGTKMAYKEEQAYLSDTSDDSELSDYSVVSSVADGDCDNGVLLCGDEAPLDEDKLPRRRKQRRLRTVTRSSVRLYGVKKALLLSSALLLTLLVIYSCSAYWSRGAGLCRSE